MNIKDTILVELDGLGEFEFEVEIEKDAEYSGDCPGNSRITYYIDIVDNVSEGKNTETGEILSFSPEIFEILEDNFNADYWITDYLEKKREEAIDW